MKTSIITGSASGIGAAVARGLRQAGYEVIDIDRASARIQADLSTPEGRRAAVDQALAACQGRCDALVLCAGLGSHMSPARLIAEVNYFGAVDLLDGLLPALAKGQDAAAVVVSSVASTQLPWDKNPLGAALEAGDSSKVAALCEAAGDRAGHLAYAGSKNALTVAVRRRVQAWAAQGVRLNALAPGAVDTPLLQAGLSDPRYGKAIEAFKAPIPRRADPDEIASVVLFLLSKQAGYVHGAQWVVDGGIDAASRPTAF